jgi:hypothetical protein
MVARHSAQREGRYEAKLTEKILHCKGRVELISSSRLRAFASLREILLPIGQAGTQRSWGSRKDAKTRRVWGSRRRR